MFTKNPAKLEARAQGYESKGKLAKAIKYRQKAARLTGGQYGGMAPLGSMQQQPLGLQQQGLGLQQPLGMQQGLGLQQQGLGLQQQPMLLQQQPIGFQQQGLGLQQQPIGFQQQGLGLQQQQGFQQWTNRTPAIYENNAVKWERRGNFAKAQKNRGKVWRLQNPQYAQMAPPPLYNNNQFLGYSVPYTPTVIQQERSIGTTTHTVLPTTVEHVVRPTLVEQTMRPERVVEVQPIVHREIDAPQVKIVEKHLYETVPSTGPSTYTNAAIVQETVHPKIIEEVQQVVHREVPAPFVERVEQHVTEHIVNPTITTKEVINDGSSTHIPFAAAGGPGVLASNTTTTAAKPGLLGKVQNALHAGNTNVAATNQTQTF